MHQLRALSAKPLEFGNFATTLARIIFKSKKPNSSKELRTFFFFIDLVALSTPHIACFHSIERACRKCSATKQCSCKALSPPKRVRLLAFFLFKILPSIQSTSHSTGCGLVQLARSRSVKTRVRLALEHVFVCVQTSICQLVSHRNRCLCTTGSKRCK
jgi:hypothetical protein